MSIDFSGKCRRKIRTYNMYTQKSEQKCEKIEQNEKISVFSEKSLDNRVPMC